MKGDKIKFTFLEPCEEGYVVHGDNVKGKIIGIGSI